MSKYRWWKAVNLRLPTHTSNTIPTCSTLGEMGNTKCQESPNNVNHGHLMYNLSCIDNALRVVSDTCSV